MGGVVEILSPARVLIVTHSATLPTGTAEVTRLIFHTLLQRYPGAYEFHQLGLRHVHAVTASPWPIYPTKSTTTPEGRQLLKQSDLNGEESFAELVARLKPDLVFAFNDPPNLEFLCVAPEVRTYKLILYVNFDGVPVPSFPRLFLADRIVTMSDFAKQAFLSKHPFGDAQKVNYIYAPADLERFHPLTEIERKELRARFLPTTLSPDAFLLGWVGLNQWRKQNWLAYSVIHSLRTGNYFICNSCCKASLPDPGVIGRLGDELPPPLFGRCGRCGASNLRRANPLENIFLWMHMPKEDTHATWPEAVLESLYGVKENRDVYYTQGYTTRSGLEPHDMPVLYQMWDCFLYLSGGEGFGVPAWESISCALPVVYTNYSSHGEFLRKANGGIAVGGTLQPEPQTGICRLIADIAQAIDAVRNIYANPELRSTFGMQGRRFVSNYGKETQADQWHSIFQSCLNGS